MRDHFGRLRLTRDKQQGEKQAHDQPAAQSADHPLNRQTKMMTNTNHRIRVSGDADFITLFMTTEHLLNRFRIPHSTEAEATYTLTNHQSKTMRLNS